MTESEYEDFCEMCGIASDESYRREWETRLGDDE